MSQCERRGLLLETLASLILWPPLNWRSLKGSPPRFSMMKFENLDVRFAILEVTESLLVVTAGFPMVENCYGLSREVWATSGTHFSDMFALNSAK